MTTLVNSDLWRQREIPDLIEALKRHVCLLKEYHDHLYQRGDEAYSGELAAKLRLLVASSGQNKPLLLRLMREFRFNPIIKLDVPPLQGADGKPIPNTTKLDDYIASAASHFQTKDGLKVISIDEYISLWANKYGSAHEDWTRSDDLIYLESGNQLASILIADLGLTPTSTPTAHQPFLHNYQMRITADMVLRVADDFINLINGKTNDEIEAVNVLYLYRIRKNHPHYQIRYAIYLAKQKRYGRAKAVMQNFGPAEIDPISHWWLIQYRPLVKEYRETCESAEALLVNGWFMSRHEDAWLVHFNYACALSCMGEVDRALDELRRMQRWKEKIPEGLLENDPDLEPVRGRADHWTDVLRVLRRGR